MPIKDQNGKRLSGSALRKRAAEQRGAYEQARVSGVTSSVIDDPPDDGAELISWSAKNLAKLLADAYRDAGLTGLDRYRIIGQLTAQLGMIRDKAAEQDKIAKLAQKHGLAKTPDKEGLEPFAGTIKPPTARGARKQGER